MTENVYQTTSVKHELSISVGINTIKKKGKMVKSHKGIFKATKVIFPSFYKLFLSLGFENWNSLLPLSRCRPPSLLQSSQNSFQIKMHVCTRFLQDLYGTWKLGLDWFHYSSSQREGDAWRLGNQVQIMLGEFLDRTHLWDYVFNFVKKIRILGFYVLRLVALFMPCLLNM
jgi:hypothetical protein